MENIKDIYKNLIKETIKDKTKEEKKHIIENILKYIQDTQVSTKEANTIFDVVISQIIESLDNKEEIIKIYNSILIKRLKECI